VREAADPTDAAVRLGEAAEAAGILVAAQRLDRVSAAVALVTIGQAAGVPLADAERIARAALSAGAR